MFKCTLEDNMGNVYIGRDKNFEGAFKDAMKQFYLSQVPRKGRGIWEGVPENVSPREIAS